MIDRRLPLLYFGFAHLCLATAAATIAVDPRGVAGFHYHPRMLAVVHLVTLGWITGSILGALYLIGPMALGSRIPGRAVDLVGFALYAIGTAGMVGHFWTGATRALPWAAAAVAAGAAPVMSSFLRALRTARAQPAVKLHFVLAFLNFFAAAALGVAIAIHKGTPFLPGGTLPWVGAHAHLAALGFATMTVMAAGYRLLPMLLPAAMPRGRRLYASALLLEIGVVSIAAAFASRAARLAAALVVLAGLGAFAVQLVWMVRNRRPPARDRPRRDWGVGLIASAFVHLALATVAGLVLAGAPTTPWTLSLVLAYGVLGLLGFLAQMVVGVGLRLLPLYAWFRGAADRPSAAPAPSPYMLVPRWLQATICSAWAAAVPLLAAGLAFDAIGAIRAGGWLLLAAVLASAAGEARAIAAARKAATSAPARREP